MPPEPPTTTAPALRVHRLRPDAAIPSYGTAHAAGLDLSACPEDGMPVRIDPGEVAMIACGIAIAIPEGYEGQVRPRSGLASRHCITLINAPGTIDADYRGEVRVPLINLGRESFVVEPGMRIAQMVIAPVARVEVQEIDDHEALGSTERGHGGFGSTGL
ncbi:MAG: dUTP diphosphatase [Planctomycetota bacterium]